MKNCVFLTENKNDYSFLQQMRNVSRGCNIEFVPCFNIVDALFKLQSNANALLVYDKNLIVSKKDILSSKIYKNMFYMENGIIKNFENSKIVFENFEKFLCSNVFEKDYPNALNTAYKKIVSEKLQSAGIVFSSYKDIFIKQVLYTMYKEQITYLTNKKIHEVAECNEIHNKKLFDCMRDRLKFYINKIENQTHNELKKSSVKEMFEQIYLYIFKK